MVRWGGEQRSKMRENVDVSGLLSPWDVGYPDAAVGFRRRVNNRSQPSVADNARSLERDHKHYVCQACLADGIPVARLQVQTRSCPMRRYLTPALIVAATLSFPLTAIAQEACPTGAWFCQADDAASPSREAAPEADAIAPPPPADSLPVPEERTAPSESRDGRMPPPVVVYQPRQTASPPPQIIIIAPGGTRVIRKAPPPVRHIHRTPVVVRKTYVRNTTTVRPIQRGWQSEWGLNARLQGIGFGGDGTSSVAPSRDAGMGGFGVSLRYRPWARFAFDAGFDIVGGTDFNGFERVETPFSLNGMWYFNPRSRSQFYVIGGVNWSRASVTSDTPSSLLAANNSGGYSADYKYFGGQLGIGLEFRLSKRLSFNVDVLGFMRSRTDIDDDGDHHGQHATSDTQKMPEYYDPASGQTTNKSGGGLFRGGLTLWW
ncbi:MAG TPA: hypothetical protein PK156_30390 [Polyangium sp.]|nr:hypothetical protein [Polyangium sp.]